MTDPITRFLALPDELLHSGRLALIGNQTSFDFRHGRYLFEHLAERGVLKRLFLPEHGLFAELQDQVALNDTSLYRDLLDSVEPVSLYGDTESTLVVDPEALDGIDGVVIDIQDVGSRYYTFATTVSYFLKAIHEHRPGLPVRVIDRINPAGRQVEGSVLPESHASFVGHPGLLHRHGLTIGELCRLYERLSGSDYNLQILPLSSEEQSLMQEPSRISLENGPVAIPPSPNMPTTLTPLVYSGQCLLEGTNLSEGRGTTRPFECFGAPFLEPFGGMSEALQQNGVVLRPFKFIPTFHKYAGEVCNGYQLHPERGYHSLLHSLRMIRTIRERHREFAFKEGVYEFRSDRPAIELLTGDETLLAYLNGRESLYRVIEKLKEEEMRWIEEMRDILLYDIPLYSVDPGVSSR